MFTGGNLLFTYTNPIGTGIIRNQLGHDNYVPNRFALQFYNYQDFINILIQYHDNILFFTMIFFFYKFKPFFK